MLPSGDPVSNKLGGWGEARAVPAAAEPGQQPTSEDRQRIADLHEPPAGLPAGGSSPLGPNAGLPGTSIMSAGYAGTTTGTISGSGTGTSAKPLGGSTTGTGEA